MMMMMMMMVMMVMRMRMTFSETPGGSAGADAPSGESGRRRRVHEGGRGGLRRRRSAADGD